ncbi:MAG: hypothetical protein KDD15_27315 [Lewinella sp.]|nr:hypothetical protein [Lewinella sp.]
MAKRNKDFSNLGPRRRPSDADIEKVLGELESEEQQQPEETVSRRGRPKSTEPPKENKDVAFHVKLPNYYYDRIDEESSRTGLPKKYIIIKALDLYFKEQDA